jgi:hypothetical protein
VSDPINVSTMAGDDANDDAAGVGLTCIQMVLLHHHPIGSVKVFMGPDDSHILEYIFGLLHKRIYTGSIRIFDFDRHDVELTRVHEPKR